MGALTLAGSILAVGGNLYSVIQFEAPLPSITYMMQLALSSNGDMSIVPGSLAPVSLAPYGGQLFMCAGSTTPWQSHLGGEESVGANGRDFAGTFATQLSSNITTAVGYNTLQLDQFAYVMRFFNVYPNNVSPSTVTQFFDPYMCVPRGLARVSVHLTAILCRPP